MSRVIGRQLSYVGRDLRYLEGFMADGYASNRKELFKIDTVMKLYEQQKAMHQSRMHRVEHRIVSQPWLRPIVCGKVNALVEFEAKLDLSLDSSGYARIEKVSFEAYNESTSLKEVVERYKWRTGHYPVRMLVDQIYRTRENCAYCKHHRIRMSGPKLGRKGSTAESKQAKKTEYQDNTDRIAVEREFSMEKHSYGLAGL